jgi:WD40 repeat protein
MVLDAETICFISNPERSYIISPGSELCIIRRVIHKGSSWVTRMISSGFHHLHPDLLESLTRHPDGNLVASGQIGKEPFITVWDSTSMEPVALLKGFHQRGICALGFSRDGNYLVSVGLDDKHTIAIWDWKKGRVLAQDTASQDRVTHSVADLTPRFLISP